MAIRGKRPCPTQGCHNLVKPGQECPLHPKRRWATSKWQKPQGWDALAARMKAEVNNTCQKCGARKGDPSRRGKGGQISLALDHRRNTRGGGTSETENLWVICSDCHHEKTQAEAREGRRIADGRKSPRPLH